MDSMLKPISRQFKKNPLLRRVLVTLFALFIMIQTYRSIYSIPNHYKQISVIKSSISSDELRNKLNKQYPYDKSSPIPPTIWQTWKTELESPKMTPRLKEYALKWQDVTLGKVDAGGYIPKGGKKSKADEVLSKTSFHHHVVPDSLASDLIQSLYLSVPEVYHAYLILPKSILRADFFRYLILYARGGLYTDMDTVPLQKLDDWVVFNETLYGDVNNAGLIIGIEADPDREDWADYYVNRIQFCQWSMLSKVGHPMLRELIIEITEITLERERRGLLKSKIEGDGDGVMNWTGPGIWTKQIFNYFNELLKNKGKNMKIINNTVKNKHNEGLDIFKDGFDWKFFTLMDEVVLIDDVMVLPITSFSPGVGHMGSKKVNDKMAYIRHMFEGSWKPGKEVQAIANDEHKEPKVP